MWPLAAGLPRKNPEPKAAEDLTDLHGVYTFASTSPGKCPECGFGYHIDDVVVSAGTHPEHSRRIVHLECFEGEAA